MKKLKEKKKLSEVIANYQDGDSFLKTPIKTILGKGYKEKMIIDEPCSFEKLDAIIQKALNKYHENGEKNPLVIGAIPFDTTKRPVLIVPQETLVLERENISEDLLDLPYILDVKKIKQVPSAKTYEEMVQQSIHRIRETKLEKVVLARTLQISTSDRVDLPPLIESLAKTNTSGYTFAINTGEKEINTLVGASPELLIRKKGNTIIANPLAGSRKRTHDKDEDARLAASLLNSEKDLHEHKVVVDMVCRELNPFFKTIQAPDQPSILYTDSMIHLSTTISGELKDPQTTSLTIASALHPTPAVCGEPREEAFQLIHEIEPFDRKFFAGIVGYMEANGDGEWIVTIRCAQVKENQITIYAGAGIVESSVPQEERAETGAKFQTMLHAIGITGENN
ncbi:MULTISPECIES: isochorismate synthase [Rummeliibacillus]|uniref:isochorismate synthase n=1 Tax=Rummeliibacillus TaxID=648802 RepID=UPI0011B655A3|nr:MULTISPECIES: isochorismate synthase [Rummeliibacillus]